MPSFPNLSFLSTRAPIGGGMEVDEGEVSVMTAEDENRRARLIALSQDDPAWLEARKQFITASAISTIVGLNQFETPADLLRKLLTKGSTQENIAMRWGSTHESNAIQAYTAITGLTVQSTGLHVSRANDWLAASPDGLVGEDGLVEAKCTSQVVIKGTKQLDLDFELGDGMGDGMGSGIVTRNIYSEKKRGPPTIVYDNYYLQIQTQLYCTERKWCDLIQWTPRAISIVRIYRNPELLEIVGRHALSFYEAWHTKDTHGKTPEQLVGVSREDTEVVKQKIVEAFRSDGLVERDMYRGEILTHTRREGAEGEARRLVKEFIRSETQREVAEASRAQ